MPILLADSGDAFGITAVTLTFTWLIIRALMAPFTQRAKLNASREQEREGNLSEEERAALANLQRTLANMERRVESLETILIETQRTKENYGTKL